MKLGQVMDLLSAGKLAHRRAWPAGEFAFLVPGSTLVVDRAPLSTILPEGSKVTYRPHIDRHYADGTIGYWTPTQDDAQESDWELFAPTVAEALTPAPETHISAAWLIQQVPLNPIFTPSYWSAVKLEFVEDVLEASPYATIAGAQAAAKTLNVQTQIVRYARAV